jgi:4-amino-4-deoxy-L-arabinose transferase-like glycosyltransferase
MDTLSLGGVKNEGRGLAAALRLSDSRLWRRVALGAILLLAAGLLFYNLNALGYANHYYTAGVASMLQSWHNFFFVAAEPGGSVSIDKPPVGLWLQAISAYFLGVNGFAMVLPEILCGLAAIVVLYHLVRRSFGTVAGLLAALALAITPIVVATDRNNTIDSSLILTLLLAAWAFIKATESGQRRYLLLGALLVGIGFNIKMLQAYLPLPAFYALYFLGARTTFWRKLGNLALASVLLLTVSFAWIAVVDLTPASQRPYVGSSGTNSELNLAIGYNGLQRLIGMGGNVTSFINRLTGASTTNGQGGFGGGRGGFGGGPGGGPGGGGAFPGTGQPGLTRLFTSPLSKEVSWLLPFGLFTLALLAFRSRLRWPIEPKHQAIVLWGGWLITGAVFFSVAGFFHEYYLSMLAAPLAALVGIGVVELWHVREQRPWLAMGLMLAAGAATLALQLTTADAYVRFAWWLLVPVVLFVTAIVWLGASAVSRERVFGLIGTASLVGAMLFIPGVWSGLTTLNTSSNQSLPAAYGGGSAGPANSGRTQVNQQLLAYLQANTQGMKYLMAVPSSMQGSDYVIATGRPVLYLGGFMGIDPVETPASLQALVSSGQLRYIYWDATGRGGGGPGGANGGDQSAISTWVRSQCTAVTGYNTNTQNQGAPDGTGNTTNTQPGGFGGGFGGQLQVTLYDCAAAG